MRVTPELRVTEKTPSKRNNKLKHFSYIIELNTPAHPIRIEVEFNQRHENNSTSKTTEIYRYTVGRLLSRYWISIGESDKKLSDVQDNQYKERWFSDVSNSRYQ